MQHDILSPEDLEEEAIYEENEGDWETGMPLGDPRPPIQDEDAEGQTGAHTAIWGGGGPTVPGEEPEEASEARRSLRLETKNEGGTHQNTKGDAGKEHHKPKQWNFQWKKQRPSSLKYQQMHVR